MKIVDFILCDDIRNELANKISIIGAYNDRIEFVSRKEQELKWPVNIRFGFYCRLIVEDGDEEFDTLELYLHLEGEQILEFKANILEGSDLSKPMVLAFPIPGVKISGPGDLVPTLKILNKNKVLKELSPTVKFKITVRNQ